MKPPTPILLFSAALLAAASRLSAQFLPDGATATLANVTNAITGSVTVGTNGSFTLLTLAENALVTNSAHGVIGRNASARSNEVTLLSSTARWQIGGTLFVGSNGAFNTLVISNGAFVENGEGSLGRNASGSNNVALITGGGSVWSNRNDLFIGGAGRGNQMVVSNGGWVIAGGLGALGRETGSSSNFVLVTGSGSVWSNAADLFVGSATPGNRLVIEAGGVVSCDEGRVGTGANAHDNEVLVTGPGSLWNNRSFTTHIGVSGSNNRLVVSNGASVRSPGGSVGSTFTFGNQVLVTGAGSSWSNFGLTIGSGGTGNRADVSDGGAILTRSGTVGFGNSGVNNTVFVRGPGSIWNGQGNLTIGDMGGGNMLIASNGATVLSSNATIGAGSTPGFGVGNDNLAWITGAGTVWSNGVDLSVGESGAGNRLVASNGASVLIGGNTTIGVANGARSNAIVLAGAGTRLLKGLNSDLIVGSTGAFNRLVISNGATAHSRVGDIGFHAPSGTNEAIVSGPGSRWTTDLNTIVGRDGSGNRLTISGGGSVSSAIGVLGLNSDGSNNVAIVTGTGSAWTNRLDCLVGNLAPGNRLVISNGGLVVVSDNVIVGVEISSTRNQLVVDGGTLRATNASGTGTLEIRRGTNVLNAGRIEVDKLFFGGMTGRFEFAGGVLSSKQSSGMHSFRVGDGVRPAMFNLADNGHHAFSGIISLSIFSNATLTGNGTIAGTLLTFEGGTLSPGASVGKLTLSNSPALQGAVLMEISKTGVTRTNDQLQVIGPLNYGGSLVVSNAGPSPLAAGDRFQLFVAPGYSGSFSSIALPALGPRLAWIDNLLEDGSIAVAAEVVTATNATVRVMAANLTSGNNQRYETPGLNIFQGLRPDIVAIQEFNVSNAFGINTAAALSNMVATTFGPEFSFFRETNNPSYSIPNGIISRFPILASGSFIDSDTGVNDRGFAWAQIDLPGTNDLFVFSVHLKASSGAANEARRAAEAAELKDLISTNFPTNAWIIVAGDMNLFSETEQAIVTLKTFVSDEPVPADQNGDPDTNLSRAQRYDRVLVSFAMTNRLVPLVMPSRIYTNGLVFDSRVYTPLSEVAPVQFGDSSAVNMQHMAVVKAFNIPFTVTNFLPAARDFGVDVSHFQNESGVPQSSWDQMFIEGKRFAFIKGTEGLTGPHDPTMSNNVARAVAAGLLAGVYHFAHPENRPTTNGAVLEASNFVVYAGSAIGPGRLRPVLDLERGSNLTTTELTDWVIAFCNEVILRRGAGAAPIIYCSQTFANNELDSRLAGYDLWLRTVNSGADPAVADPPPQGVFTNATGVFTNWAFWQYSATGSSGGLSPLDLNVCHSEFKPLNSFVIPPLPPAPAIQVPTLTGGVFQLTFTSTPGASFTVLASGDPGLPLNSWTPIGTATEITPGVFRFSDTNVATRPQRFFIIRSP